MSRPAALPFTTPELTRAIQRLRKQAHEDYRAGRRDLDGHYPATATSFRDVRLSCRVNRAGTTEWSISSKARPIDASILLALSQAHASIIGPHLKLEVDRRTSQGGWGILLEDETDTQSRLFT